MATILIKKSDTASSVPLAADLTNATGGVELAVNTADKKIYTKTPGGTVVELTGLKAADIGTTVQAYDAQLSTLAGASADRATFLASDQAFSMRNRIINGDMRIDQRNAGASVTPNNAYTLDRWLYENAQTSKASVQQNAGSVTPPAGFTNYLGVTSLSAYSSLSTDYFVISQKVEGFNVADLGWGSASAQAVTLSFWVRSSLTGTHSGAFVNNASNRSYAFTFTVSAANTWEYKTITVPGDTTGTWLTTNGAGIVLRFNLGSGSGAVTTAGSWLGSNSNGASGSVSIVGTNGATFYITGVQLEAGTVATPFERRPYGTELALCQRYYQVLSDNSRLSGMAFSASVNPMWWQFAVQMRATPSAISLSGVGTSTVLCGGANISLTSISSTGGSVSGVFFDANTAGGGTAGFGTQLRLVGSTISASSEL